MSDELPPRDNENINHLTKVVIYRMPDQSLEVEVFQSNDKGFFVRHGLDDEFGKPMINSVLTQDHGVPSEYAKLMMERLNMRHFGELPPLDISACDMHDRGEPIPSTWLDELPD